MRFEVVLAHDAERDHEAVCDYISETDSPINAERGP